MKKVNSLVLSTLTAAFLVGCGGGSSSSTSTTDTSTSPTTPTASSTTIPVTKGSLLMATAIDSGSPVKIGTQIDGTNKYTFTGDITYPITVTGGYVDVNDNGIVDEGDYSFKGKLSSYSTVVTPITTYLGDTSKDAGKTKLDALKTLAGITSDDDLLKNDPSETNGNVLALVASIYQSYPSLMDNDNSNDSNTEGNQDLSTMFADYKSVISQGTFEGETVKQKMIRVEQQLRDTSHITEKIEDKLDPFTLTEAMLINKTIEFTFPERSSTMTFGFLSEFKNDFDGITSISGSFYELFSDNEYCHGDWLFDSTKKNTIQIDYWCYVNGNRSDTFIPNGVIEPHYSTDYITINSELKSGLNITRVDGNNSSTLTITSISNVLSLAGKIISVNDQDSDPSTSTFNEDGTYTEIGSDEDGPYSCSGLWQDFGNNKIGVTCEDSGTNAIPDGIVGGDGDEIILQFNSSTLIIGDTATSTYFEGESKLTDTITITSISNIQ